MIGSSMPVAIGTRYAVSFFVNDTTNTVTYTDPNGAGGNTLAADSVVYWMNGTNYGGGLLQGGGTNGSISGGTSGLALVGFGSTTAATGLQYAFDDIKVSQILQEFALTTSVGANGAISPASINVLAGGSANFVITASNYYRIATLTNGTGVTGLSFDNSSTATNFTWSNVQAAGVLAATFTNQVANDPASTPYSWLAQYGLTNYNTDAVADQDSDGLKAWQEYLADTNPTNAASRLAFTGLNFVSNDVQIRWIGGSAAWQSVECCNSLTNTNGWHAIYTNTPPTAITNTLLDTTARAATNRFYRLKAWR